MSRLDTAARRAFLRQAGACGLLLGSAAPLALQLGGLAAAGQAAAQAGGGAAANDCRALVCVFLCGGNDAYNTVVAQGRFSLGAHLAARNQGGGESIGLAPIGVPPNPSAALGSPARLGGVLRLGGDGVSRNEPLGLHPLLTALPPLYL